MCRQETIKYACGHTEVGFLFECPVEHKKMREHKFLQTITTKINSVCFACDIPNLHPENLRDARRHIQLAVLAKQRKEQDEGAENGTISWTPGLLAAKKRREESLKAEGRMEKKYGRR